MVAPASPSDPVRTAARPRVRARSQAAVTAVVGAIAFSVGTLLVTLTFGGAVGWGGLQALVPPLHALAWALLVALALPYVGGSDLRLAALSVATAPIVAVVMTVARFGHPGDGGILLVVAGWQAVTLTGAALIGAIAGVIHARRRATASGQAPAHGPASSAESSARTDPAPPAAGPRRGGLVALLPAAVLVSLTVGVALTLALPLQWFAVSFSIWTPPDPPTAEEIARYEWTAGLALAFLVIAVALALVRRRAGLIATASVALVIGIGAAFVLQVPAGRFTPEPATVVEDGDHPVCFGTTGDCPGG